MSAKPMHGRILRCVACVANEKVDRVVPNAMLQKMRLRRQITMRSENAFHLSSCHSSQSDYFSRSERFGTSFHLSRAAGLISERGRKDR
jgi:hypothetical protein